MHAGVLAELAEVGYAGLTIDSVAARAQTGKASIYRRWPTKKDLVIDAFCAYVAASFRELDELAATDCSTRDVLLELGRQVVTFCGGSGEALRAVAGEVTRYPELAAAIEQEVHAPKRALVVALLRRGVDRGEVRPDAVTELNAELLPAMLMHRMVLTNRGGDPRMIAEIVDEVVLPLIRAE